MYKFNLWLNAFLAEIVHSTNAASAESAWLHHTTDRVRSVQRVVDRNLLRIAQREQLLSEFHKVISESTSLKEDKT